MSKAVWGRVNDLQTALWVVALNSNAQVVSLVQIQGIGSSAKILQPDLEVHHNPLPFEMQLYSCACCPYSTSEVACKDALHWIEGH